jgi:PEP-CTERM motif
MLSRLCQVIVIVIFGLGVGATKASTFNVDGTFSNGAFLTGSIDLNGGLLLSVDLNANGSLPGDNATHWSGPVFCVVTCTTSNPSYSYVAPLFNVTETYLAASKTYDFIFNGGGSLAYLDLKFALEPSGTILGGLVFDPACGGVNCPPAVGLTGGTISPSATPLPSTEFLFLTGIGLLGLLAWRTKRKAVLAT